MAPDEALSVAVALLRAALFVAAHVGNGPAPATRARRSRATPGVRVSRSWQREICAPMDELSAHASNRRPALKNEGYGVPTPDVVLEVPEVSRATAPPSTACAGRRPVVATTTAGAPFARASWRRTRCARAAWRLGVCGGGLGGAPPREAARGAGAVSRPDDSPRAAARVSSRADPASVARRLRARASGVGPVALRRARRSARGAAGGDAPVASGAAARRDDPGEVPRGRCPSRYTSGCVQ
jgi:hypothetical protein